MNEKEIQINLSSAFIVKLYETYAIAWTHLEFNQANNHHELKNRYIQNSTKYIKKAGGDPARGAGPVRSGRLGAGTGRRRLAGA